MILLAGLCAVGLVAGFLLLRSVPVCAASGAATDAQVSVIVPARNEEHNLPRLLDSLPRAPLVNEVIVVDDGSKDATASVAAARGATVLKARPLPEGWTGKTWACFQGAEAASGAVLVFLDADTWFEPGGFNQLLHTYADRKDAQAALSVLPYHVVRKPYEQLSLFFNLMMAFGAGGFGWFGGERLFGQSLVIARPLYEAAGGHAAVRGRILENVAMAEHVRAAGGQCVCMGGKGVLNIRMFPEGFAQLCEGWTKAFADGAAASDGRVLGVSIVWLTALCTIALLLVLTTGSTRMLVLLLYLCAAAQIRWMTRLIGTYSLAACVLFPVPLVFFFALFARSLIRRAFKRQVTWRGRTV